MDRDFYSFARLCDVKLPLTVRIASLQGSTLPARDVFVTAQLFAEGRPLTLPYQTAYKAFKNGGDRRHKGASRDGASKTSADNGAAYEEGPSAAALASAARDIEALAAEAEGLRIDHVSTSEPTVHSRDFGEMLVFPIRLCDLPLSSQLVFTAWDAASVEEVDEAFFAGKKIEDDVENASGLPDYRSMDPARTRMPFAKVLGGTTMKLFGKKGTLKKASHRLYLWKGMQGDGALEPSTPSKVANDPSRKRDEMARLEKLIKLHERSELPHLPWLDKLAYRQIEKIHQEEMMHSEDVYLYVDLPRFEMPIVYCEQEATAVPPNALAQQQQQQGAGPPYSAVMADAQGLASSAARGIDASLFTVYDGDMLMERENPVEAKHRRLVRSHRSGPLDRELKPNAGVRDELNEILSYPPTRALTSAESDLLWSFRFYLSRFPSGLTKFLKSVSWYDHGEAKQATEVLMPMWSEIGMDDALELLGPGFKDPRVRAYAVRKLERADNEELNMYLLQLVQALKFDLATAGAGQRREREGDATSALQEAAGISPSASSVASSESGLADFLVRRACADAILGNNLYWYLQVECDDRRYGKMFKRIRNTYLERLGKVPQGAERRETFRRQTELVNLLSTRAKELRMTRDARPRKIERLRGMINDVKGGLHQFEPPLPLPLDADVEVSGIRAEKSTVFKSNLFPMLLHFERSSVDVQAVVSQPGDDSDAAKQSASTSVDDYAVIFKNGDDLRQDQLVIQLFTLMDRLLRNENLDLCITPYRVLATGAVDGMVQYVESMTLASILGQYGNSLLNYLRAHHPDKSDEAVYGVKASVFETYLRSCAGYSVITYLLGVGDRHLDNLLLTPDGHFFHVDFGYILNRDPKPFPPAVKVSREMVEAMGGTSSPHYTKFKKLCFTAFTTLRKSANLILNLVNLMVDANVTDIRFEPDKAVLKIQEKFKLDLGDEEAIRAFDDMLNETSYITLMLDRLHDAAQFFRS